MHAVLVSILAFVSTFLGGLLALKFKDRMHLVLGFTAGVILGVVSFDVLPEVFELARQQHIETVRPMIALVVGFLVFHVLEKAVLVHHAQEENYGDHHHPHVGVLSAAALIGHSFMDGVGIGLGFQVSPVVGFSVAFAVIAHDFCDGLNTVSLMLAHHNTDRKSLFMLGLDALAPVLGAASVLFFTVPGHALVLYLGFFAGFLLYIGASDILPEAHARHSSPWTLVMTCLGAFGIFWAIHFAGH
jgi:zinc transporter ZupT